MWFFNHLVKIVNSSRSKSKDIKRNQGNHFRSILGSLSANFNRIRSNLYLGGQDNQVDKCHLIASQTLNRDKATPLIVPIKKFPWPNMILTS